MITLNDLNISSRLEKISFNNLVISSVTPKISFNNLIISTIPGITDYNNPELLRDFPRTTNPDYVDVYKEY